MSIEQDARAESVRVYPLPHAEPRNANERRSNGITSAHRAGYVKGYIAGASRPVTDEQVEAAAHTMWLHEHTTHAGGVPSYDWDEDDREYFSFQARAALEAARALADKETP